MKKITPIEKSSSIAIVSPSWGGPSEFPQTYRLGITRLREEFGFKIIEYPTTKGESHFNYSHPQARAQDLIRAFQDEAVDGIICSIGGDDSIRLLEYLDNFKFKPKFFMGYSDSTVLLNYFYQKGFYTFYGPSVMAGFAEPNKLYPEFRTHIERFLLEKWKVFHYTPYTEWTDEPMEWGNPKSLQKVRQYLKNTAWKQLEGGSGEKEVSGILWGGCLDSLEMIKGTRYWPIEKKFWHDKIIFWELSDEGVTPGQLKRILRNYGVQEVFKYSKAILFGRFSGLTEVKRVEFDKIISEVIRDEFSSTMPVVLNLDFGHTYPQQIIPLGAKATIKIGSGIQISVDSPFIYD